MTRQVWSIIGCGIVLVLSIAGFFGPNDFYDTRHPMYALVAHIAPAAEIAHAEAYSDAVRRQDMAAIARETDPSQVDSIVAIVPKAAAYYPSVNPTSAGPLSYTVTADTSGRKQSSIVITHRYPNGSAIVTTTTTNRLNGKISGFFFHLLTAEDLRKIRFDPLAADTTQAVFLALVAALVLFTTYTLYRCLSTPGVRFKWLWLIFITAGVGSLRFNWMTETMSVVPIDIHWGAAGFFQNVFWPAFIYLNFPLGAVVFWLTHSRRPAATVRHPEY